MMDSGRLLVSPQVMQLKQRSENEEIKEIIKWVIRFVDMTNRVQLLVDSRVVC